MTESFQAADGPFRGSLTPFSCPDDLRKLSLYTRRARVGSLEPVRAVRWSLGTWADPFRVIILASMVELSNSTLIQFRGSMYLVVHPAYQPCPSPSGSVHRKANVQDLETHGDAHRPLGC